VIRLVLAFVVFVLTGAPLATVVCDLLWNSLKPGIGATVSMSVVPSALESIHGDRATFGFGLFLTLRPAAMATGDAPHVRHRMP
jgi:hypothetical protein